LGIRSILHNFLNWFLKIQLRLIFIVWKRNNRYSNVRLWSNDELKKISSLFQGDVINISAGKDRDKENGQYKTYFNNARSYTISNYIKIFDDSKEYNEIALDLNVPLPDGANEIAKFDVVFSHTVLEHIYQIKTAVNNLCKMSKDIVVTVIPFIQAYHQESPIYHDYWRISPYALIKLFNENSFKTVYINWNNDPVGSVYIIHVASKHPENWEKIRKLYRYNNYGPGYQRQLLEYNIRKCENSELKQFDFESISQSGE
jgi:hypothetical protein